MVLSKFSTMSKKRGKGLLNKAESMKEFATQTRVKYAASMDLLLDGDKLKLGEINNLCSMDDYEAITDFGSMSDKEKDEHIYVLYGRVSKYKSDEYMHKWLSFFTIVHKQTLQAKAGRYLKLKKLKLDTWAEGVKLGRRADILSVFVLSALISKHTLVHLRNGNLWTTMEMSNCDHDDLLKNCDVHLAYLGNGLFSEIKPKVRDSDLSKESGKHKPVHIASKVKPTTSTEPVSTITIECAQTQDRLSGTITNKHDITGTTTMIVTKGTTSGTGVIPAGTTINVANIDPNIELAGTTTSVVTKSIDIKPTLNPSVYCSEEGMTTSLDEVSVETKEVVIGSIDSDASTLQLLVSGNARSKDANVACSKSECGMHSPPPIAHKQDHVHATHSNIVVKNVQINLRRVTDLDIDLWMAPKPTTYPDDKKPTKPVYKSMHKSDPNKSDESTHNLVRTDKQTVKKPRKHDKDKNQKTKVTVRSGKKFRSTVSSNKPSFK